MELHMQVPHMHMPMPMHMHMHMPMHITCTWFRGIPLNHPGSKDNMEDTTKRMEGKTYNIKFDDELQDIRNEPP